MTLPLTLTYAAAFLYGCGWVRSLLGDYHRKLQGEMT